MRKIELEELQLIKVEENQYMKSNLCNCKTNPLGCFINDHGIIRPHCDRFIWHHDGFKCDKVWQR